MKPSCVQNPYPGSFPILRDTPEYGSYSVFSGAKIGVRPIKSTSFAHNFSKASFLPDEMLPGNVAFIKTPHLSLAVFRKNALPPVEKPPPDKADLCACHCDEIAGITMQ